MPSNFLMVIGSSAHAVRSGSGTQESAAREAFGAGRSDLQRITFRKMALETLRVDVKRTHAICELLKEHKVRFIGDPEIVRACDKEIFEIRAAWLGEWEKYEKRYGVKLK